MAFTGQTFILTLDSATSPAKFETAFNSLAKEEK